MFIVIFDTGDEAPGFVGPFRSNEQARGWALAHLEPLGSIWYSDYVRPVTAAWETEGVVH